MNIMQDKQANLLTWTLKFCRLLGNEDAVKHDRVVMRPRQPFKKQEMFEMQQREKDLWCVQRASSEQAA